MARDFEPDIFLYLDYRQFLRDYCGLKITHKKGFSYRNFARQAELGSGSYLQMVISGQRNLAPLTINKFIKALQLAKREASYFEALVLFNQAELPKEREFYFERLTRLKPSVKLTGLRRDQYLYFSRLYYVILREMVALPDFREDPEWIADRMPIPFKSQAVAEALQVLINLGLLKRDEAGRLRHATSSLVSPAEVTSLDLANFHRDMLSLARDAILSAPPEDREISSLTVPLPKKLLPELKSLISQFNEKVLETINQADKDYDQVYHFSVQLFPVSKREP